MCKDFASAIKSSGYNSNDLNNNNNNKENEINSRLYLLTSNYWPSSFQPAKSTSVTDTAQSTYCEVATNDVNDNINKNTSSVNTSSLTESAIHSYGNNNVTN